MKSRVLHSQRRRRPRRGFSLAELLVAMTLLSIVLMSLAKITFTIAARGRTNDINAKRNAVLIQEANKFNAMVYDSIGKISTADKVLTMGDFKFTRQIKVDTTSATRRTIRIYIIPALDATRKDSVSVHRSMPAGSPLCVGC